MEINEINEGKVNKLNRKIDHIDFNQNDSDEPVLNIAKEAGFSLTKKQESVLEIEKLLTKREMIRWKRLSKSKRNRIIKQVMHSHTGFNLKKAIEKAEKNQQNEILNKALYYDKELRVKEKADEETKKQKRDHRKRSDCIASETRTNNIILKSNEAAANTINRDVKKAAETSVTAGTGGTSQVVKAGKKVTEKVSQKFKEQISKKDKKEIKQEEKQQIATPAIKLMKPFVATLSVIIASAGAAISTFLLPVILVISIIISICTIPFLSAESIKQTAKISIQKISESALEYRDDIHDIATEEGMTDYESLILAIIMTESGGNGNDIMGCGASTPKESLKNGIKILKNQITLATELGCDLKSAVQAYNYGPQFLNFVSKNHKGKYSLTAAKEFAKNKCAEQGLKDTSVNNPNSWWVEWRNELARADGYLIYKFGNCYYVPVVWSYLSNSIYDIDKLQTLFETALACEGNPYLFGGTDPENGIDCSAFMQYCYKSIGISLPRTAQMQHDSTLLTIHKANEKDFQPMPGDLVFFKNTYKSLEVTITHVEMVYEPGKSFGAGNPIGFHDLNDAYHLQHIDSYGRFKPSVFSYNKY
jgi:hypothetical protein